MKDLKITLRQLLKNPGFTAVTVLILVPSEQAHWPFLFPTESPHD